MNEEKKVSFKIQIPNPLIRNSTLDSTHFVVYAKLIQMYYYTGQSKVMRINHDVLKFSCCIKDNRKLKKALIDLHKRELIVIKFNKKGEFNFPKQGLIDIEMNEFFNLKKVGRKKEDRFFFAQLSSIILNRDIIEQIGHFGVRLMYYYKSYINPHARKERDDGRIQYHNFCWTSILTIAEETGISEKSVRTYNKKLEKIKFIKITKHELGTTYEYIKKKDTEELILQYSRYNNHYEVREDRIEIYYDKLKEKSNT
jgi:hypothetical protein